MSERIAIRPARAPTTTALGQHVIRCLFVGGQMPVLGLLSLLPLEESTHPQLFCRTLLFAQPQIRPGTNRRAQRAATNAPKQSVSTI